MRCKRCGKEVADNSSFCNFCGKAFDKDKEAINTNQGGSGCLMWCIWGVLLLTGLIWFCEGCAILM